MHVPLTGGSWLTYKLRAMDEKNTGTGREVLLAEEDHPKYVPVGRHTTLQNIYEVSDVDISTYFKFSISRHPYTKFQSAWNYLSNVRESTARLKLKNQFDLMSWIEDGSTTQHILPQVNWYDKRFTKIFNFEIIEQVNFSKLVPLCVNYDKRKNPIVRSKYEELDDNLKERVYNHYRKDFKLFHYKP